MNPRVAALQMNSGDEVAANLDVAARLIEQAAGEGICLAVLPENCAFMGARERDKMQHAEADGRGPIQERLATLAQRHRLCVVAGTVPLALAEDPDRVAAACLVYGADGERLARYDKIHLFDVQVSGGSGAQRYRESASIAPGAWNPVVVPTPAGRLGLSVCYDLRFPELYRALAEQQADLMCVPAAFTERTGEAHWELLLRARAVENQCVVIAPNQYGQHPGGRSTWGHSMVVGPWGEVLACTDAGEAVVAAEVDRQKLAELREGFPVLSHRRSPGSPPPATV